MNATVAEYPDDRASTDVILRRHRVKQEGKMKCECCDNELRFQWCDTHGVGACITCGMPYTIYHYEEIDGARKRVDKPPSVALSPVGVEIAKRYWREEHARVFPASYDMGIGRGGRSYSGATPDDCDKFGAWYKAHEQEFSKEPA